MVNHTWGNCGQVVDKKIDGYFGCRVRRGKLYSRIIRFQHSIKIFNTASQTTFSQLALDSGYADQAHFIREFNEFSSLKPSQYFKKRNAPILPFVKH